MEISGKDLTLCVECVEAMLVSVGRRQAMNKSPRFVAVYEAEKTEYLALLAKLKGVADEGAKEGKSR